MRTALKHNHSDCPNVSLKRVVRYYLGLFVAQALKYTRTKKNALSFGKGDIFMVEGDLPIERVDERAVDKLHMIIVIDKDIF